MSTSVATPPTQYIAEGAIASRGKRYPPTAMVPTLRVVTGDPPDTMRIVMLLKDMMPPSPADEYS